MYGFNPLTSLDLFSSPVDERVSFDGNRKAHVVKDLQKWMNNMHLKPIRKGKQWFLNQKIEFGCI